MPHRDMFFEGLFANLYFCATTRSYVPTYVRTFVISIIITLRIDCAEHLVQLGDPWSVGCNTPYKEPPSWIFTSADRSYDNYIYDDGKFTRDMEEKRYNLSSTNDGLVTLEVSKTDKDHAGKYGCWPDTSSLEGRQYYNLNLIEYSHMNISINTNKSTTLYMDISCLSNDPIKPVFQCTFLYGKRIMEETICDVYKNNDFVRCSLKKLYEPDDDVPHRCEIFLNNKLWSQENLFLNAASKIEVVMKGTSWNATCETASSYPMKWLFNKDTPHNTSIVLYSKWIPNQNYSQSYNFQVSNDRRVYDMIIPRVDLNHSGTYMCTHKSSDHLIERKIDLLVIDDLSINLNDQHQLIMFVSYMGNNDILPSFKCDVNNITINMTNMACQNSVDKLTRCYLVERFENLDVPESCYILLADNMFKESFLSDLKPREDSKNSFIITWTLLVAFISLSVILLGFIIYTKKFRNLQSNKQGPELTTNSPESESLEPNDTFPSAHVNQKNISITRPVSTSSTSPMLSDV